MSNDYLQEAIAQLEALQEETDLSKRFKEKNGNILVMLKRHESFAVEKAIGVLEELNYSDIPAYYKEQVWSVISLLESVK